MLQVTKFLNDLSNYLSTDSIQDHALFSMNQLKSEVTNRIHNSEAGVKDKEGNRVVSNSKVKLGAYSLGYGKERRKKGFQVAVMDYEVSGDLRRSLKTVISPDFIKVTLDNSTSVLNGKVISNRKKAEYLTKQHGRGDVIWKASNTEVNNFYELFESLIKQDIKQIYESSVNK